jgi:hypothetical protein
MIHEDWAALFGVAGAGYLLGHTVAIFSIRLHIRKYIHTELLKVLKEAAAKLPSARPTITI